MRSRPKGYGAEAEFRSTIITSNVSFSFSEASGFSLRVILVSLNAVIWLQSPPTVEWREDDIKFALRLNTSDEFWALNRCIYEARHDFNCSPLIRPAKEEMQTLQEHLDRFERVAFLTTLEQFTMEA